MLIVRPSRLADLQPIERLVGANASNVTALPADPDKLRHKIMASIQSFAAEVESPGDESYFFVLENIATGEIVGTCGITASAGFNDRFYSYRNEVIVHASQELKVSNRINSLHLCNDLTGHTLLTSFYIDPALAHTEWPQLLSRARLLFINEFPRRFADRIAAELPGTVDAQGVSPFWDAVGKRFFNMDYPQADRLSGGRSKTFIAELMPQYPIYVPLLPRAAQDAIGKPNPAGELPLSILIDEGFEADRYVDIFDAGPTVEARLRMLRTSQLNRRVKVKVRVKVRLAAEDNAMSQPSAHPSAQSCLVAATARESFRATIADASLHTSDDDGEIALPQTIIDALGIKAGDVVRAAPFGDRWSAAA